ncbi:MAG: hypothetical protein ABIZ91_12940 [Gemmatimonadaceae bacterium]
MEVILHEAKARRCLPAPRLAEGGNEAPERLVFAAARDPQDAFAVEVQDHRHVAMPGPDREFLDRNAPNPIQGILGAPQPRRQRPRIDLLRGVPPHAQPLGDVLDGQHLRQSHDLLCEARSNPLIAIEPWKVSR